MRKKIIISSLFIIETILLVFASFKAFKPNDRLNVPADAWAMESSDSNSAVSPYFYIDKGSYLVSIQYSIDNDAIIAFMMEYPHFVYGGR